MWIKKTAVLAITGSLFLASCTTQNPYTGQEQVSDTAIGAGIGAAVGAIGGLLIGGGDGNVRRNRALIAAGVGALAGGAVGNYMDRQAADIRKELQGTGVSVTRSGESIILNMPGNITFPTNQSAINASFYPVLNSVATVLKKYDKTIVDVYGFTDSTGSADYNMKLSKERALSVANYLLNQGVTPPERFVVQGFGEQNPIASNDTEQGRAANRRVEVQIQPYTGT